MAAQHYQAESTARAKEDAASYRNDRRPARSYAAWAVCAGAVCVVAGAALRPRLFAAVASGEALDAITGDHRYDWSVYKYAIPVGNASLVPLKTLASAIFGPVTVSDLGCGGMKLSAGTTAPAGARIHFVQSSILSNDPTPVDDWERYWETLNGDMSAFNGFMHGKATLFTSAFPKVLATIEGLGLPVLRRKSSAYTFNATRHPDWTGSLLHALFPLRGRIFEIVGPATFAAEASLRTSAWADWASAECPAAHRLDDDLERYASTFAAYSTGAGVASANSTQYADWAATAGYWPPMLVAVSAAVPARFVSALEAGTTKLRANFEALTGTELGFEYSEGGDCAVAHASTVGSRRPFVFTS